jgi:hypothetical protein
LPIFSIACMTLPAASRSALLSNLVDADALIWDMRRRVNLEALPSAPVLARLKLHDARGRADVRDMLALSPKLRALCLRGGRPPRLRTSRASFRVMEDRPGFLLAPLYPRTLTFRSPVAILLVTLQGELS